MECPDSGNSPPPKRVRRSESEEEADITSYSEDEDEKNNVNKEKNPLPQYLDTIPENALENMVRLLSPAPRAKDWQTYIRVGDLVPLYDVGSGVFGDFLCRRFNTLYAAPSNHQYFDTKQIFNSNLGPDKRILRADFDVPYVDRTQQLLRVYTLQPALGLTLKAGKSLHTLIADDYEFNILNTAHLLDYIATECPNVRSLSIVCEGIPTDQFKQDTFEWLCRFGERLACLEVTFLPPIKVI